MTEPTTDDITAAEPAISAQEIPATVMANDAPVAEKDTRATEEIGPKEVESGSIAVYTPLRTLEIPTPISALAFGHASHLFVGAGVFPRSRATSIQSLGSLDRAREYP